MGSSDGVGTNAAFGSTVNIVFSSNGHLYVSDSENHRIKQIVIATQAVTTFVGSGVSGSTDGFGTDARVNYPTYLAEDSNGNMYWVDSGLKIRKIVLASGRVTTVVSVTMSWSGGFNRGIGCGNNGKLYAIMMQTGGAEAGYYMKVIDVDTGNMASLPSSFLYNGNAAWFDAFAMDAHGYMFLTALPAWRIRQYDMSAQSLTMAYLVGSSTQSTNSIDGFGTNIELKSTTYLTVDSVHGILYLYEDGSNKIRMVQTSAPCTAGKWCPPGSTALDQGGPCPAGYWCPQGMDRIACPVGSYCTAVGASTTPTFFSCSLGYFCPVGSSSLDQGGPCPGGYYCPGGNPQYCSVGQYCPRGSSILNQGGICAGGYYCAAGAERITCPAGTYCTIGTVNPPQSCSAGKYCPAGSSVVDQAGPCPAGTFCAAGADRVNCTNGFYCPPGSATLDQAGACPAGFMCPSGVDRVPCIEGFACTGGLARMQCTAGTYASAGSSTCTQCPRGLVAANAGTISKHYKIIYFQ